MTHVGEELALGSVRRRRDAGHLLRAPSRIEQLRFQSLALLELAFEAAIAFVELIGGERQRALELQPILI